MAVQRLTTLDIKIIADELAVMVIGRKLESITRSGGDIFFCCGNFVIRYSVVAGAPFLSLIKKAKPGNDWLNLVRGGIIEGVTQFGHDRIIKFDIGFYDSLGRKTTNYLFVELFANGNIILTDDKPLVRSSQKRSYNSGELYKPELSNNEILKKLLNGEYDRGFQAIIEEFKLLPYLDSNSLNSRNFTEICKNPRPHLIINEAEIIIGYSFYLPSPEDIFTFKHYGSLLEALAVYIDSYTPGQSKIIERLIKQKKRLAKKIASIESDLQEASKNELYSKYGEMILANLGRLHKGMRMYELPDPYSESSAVVKIEADPALAPDENASSYFVRSRKLKSSIEVLRKRLEQEKTKLREIEDKIAAPPAEEIRQHQPKQKQQKTRQPFRQVDLVNGWQVFVGKSALDNDELTFSFAHKGDIWLHAWQAAGSHTVLRHSDKNQIPPKAILEQAAALAAFYSKAKHSSKVPVIYTEIRHVRKIKNTPGKVIVSREKQLMVRPLGPENFVP